VKTSMRFALVAGSLLCAATQAFAGGTYFRTQPNTTNLPISNDDTIIVSVSVPAGSWTLEAVAPIKDFVDLVGFVACDILVDDVSVTGETISDGMNGSVNPEMTLIGVAKTKGKSTTIALGCRDAIGSGNNDVQGGASLLVSTSSTLK